MLSLFPYLNFQFINRLLSTYPVRRRRQLHIGKGARLGKFGLIVLDNDDSLIQIGANTTIGDRFAIVSDKPVRIGSNCLFSWNVSVVSHVHPDPPGKIFLNDYSRSKEILIGDNVLVGCNVVFLTGSGIGNNSVVGANAVVTKMFPDNCVIAGNPANILRMIS